MSPSFFGVMLFSKSTMELSAFPFFMRDNCSSQKDVIFTFFLPDPTSVQGEGEAVRGAAGAGAMLQTRAKKRKKGA